MDHDFANRYRTGATPWDIGRPQRGFVEHAERITGDVLDVGCGTGELTIFAASRSGTNVLGIDITPAAVEAARAKARGRGVEAEFEVASALELGALGREFDAVLDCLVLHIFEGEELAGFVDGVRQVLRSGGLYLSLVFSDAEPEGAGPRRISEPELRNAFADGFAIESIAPVRIEINDAEGAFTPGGPHGWFSIVRRTATAAH